MLISCHDGAQAPWLPLRLEHHIAFSLGAAWGCVCGKHSAPGGRERSRQRPPHICTEVAHWRLGFPHVNFRGTRIFRPQQWPHPSPAFHRNSWVSLCVLILQKYCSTRCLSTKFCEIIYTEPIIVASFLTPGLPHKQLVLAAGQGGPATQFCTESCANPRRSPQQFHLRKMLLIVCLCGAATGRTCGHTHNTQTPHHIYTTYTSHTIYHTWIHTTHHTLYTIHGHIPYTCMCMHVCIHIHGYIPHTNITHCTHRYTPHITCTPVMHNITHTIPHHMHILHITQTHHTLTINSTQTPHTQKAYHIYTTDTHTTHHTQTNHMQTPHTTHRHMPHTDNTTHTTHTTFTPHIPQTHIPSSHHICLLSLSVLPSFLFFSHSVLF